MKESEVKLTEDYVDLDINCTLQLGELAEYHEPVELCVIAVTENNKICVGSVEVSLKENIHS